MQIEQADKGALQLEESIPLQRTGWKIQAFMKVFILALLVCGLPLILVEHGKVLKNAWRK